VDAGHAWQNFLAPLTEHPAKLANCSAPGVSSCTERPSTASQGKCPA
jgi:hypothetical protein